MKTLQELEEEADTFDFRCKRIVDERGFEKTVKCFVYDKHGDRVYWEPLKQ